MEGGVALRATGETQPPRKEAGLEEKKERRTRHKEYQKWRVKDEGSSENRHTEAAIDLQGNCSVIGTKEIRKLSRKSRSGQAFRRTTTKTQRTLPAVSQLL